MTLPSNPALRPLAFLVGAWDTVGAHPAVTGALHGRTTFEWIEGGAFLLMRSEVDDPRFPSGVAIFASDGASDALFMLYFDERTVSRKYDASFTGGVLRWWREDPSFSQRNELTLGRDGRTMTSRGEMSREGGPWEGDLSLTYTRARG